MENNLEKFGEIVGNVNSAIDIRVFVDSHKSKNLVQREQFVNYEEWKQSLNEKEYEVMDHEAFAASKALNSFLGEGKHERNSGIESENFSKLSELISYSEGRKLFVETLQAKVGAPGLVYENLTQLAALIKELLSSMVRENESEPSIFSNVISLSVVFYTEENGRRKTLANYISPHSVWIDPKRWMQAITYNINTKAAVEKEISQKTKKKSRFFNFISEIVKNPANSQDRAEKASVYLILSQFSFHMVKLNVPTDIATSIIINSARDYKIDEEKVMLLISEIQARSNIPLKVSPKPLLPSNNLFGILSKCMKFLSTSEIFELSQVSKEWNKVLRRKRYKRILLNASVITNYPDLRRIIWAKLLEIEEVPMDYWQIVSQLDNSPNLLGELTDVIEVDVARSFQKNTEINSRNLKNILKAYALFNKNLGYCQGMNYIAGTLFLVIQDEEASCRCLSAMIEMFSMNSLFTNNLKKLKKLFYIFDRLIVMYLPEINETFKDAWVFSDHFSSAWFLTLFSSILHTKFEILVKIWDLFFLQGWKAIFKICIVILKKYSEKLIDKSFEDILFIINGLTNSNIFEDEFFRDVSKVKLSNRIIEEIENEYEKIVIRSINNY